MEHFSPQLMDYLLLAFVAIILPVRSYLYIGELTQKIAEGHTGALRASYIEILWTLWLLAAGVMLAWFWFDRPLSLLGLTAVPDLPHVAGWGFVALVTVLLLWQVRQARTNIESAQSFMRRLEAEPDVSSILPSTPADYRLFKSVSLTAGITEEIIYRGYLIWLFGLWLSPSLAAIAALLVFVLGHLYQGTAVALLRVTGIGAVLTLLYLWSGSLLPAIVLHVVVDLASGATVWHARKKCLEAQETA